MSGNAAGSGWTFRARPLFWLALAFIAGISLSGLLPPAWNEAARVLSIPLLAAAAWFLLARLGSGRRPPAAAISLLVVFLAMGLLRGQAAAPSLPCPIELDPYFERPATVFIARLQSPPDFTACNTRFFLKLQAAMVDGQKIPVAGGVQLSVGRTERTWTVGTVVKVPLTLKRFHNYGTPGAFDYVWVQGARGLYARAYLKTDAEMIRCRSPESNPGPAWRPAAAVDGYRQRLRRWIHGRLDRGSAVLAQALLLGYRYEIEPEFRDALARSGLNHLLAISGLHLGLVAAGLFFCGRRLAGLLFPRLLRRSSDRHPAWGLALTGAVLYALISGLALPTWRAGLMLVLLAAAVVNYRQPDPPTVLAAAALLMLVYDPNAMWMVSFQLSFGAFLGILLLFPRFRPIMAKMETVRLAIPLGWCKPFLSAFFLSLAVNVVILPIVAYHFHGVSLAAFFANALLVPLVGFLVLPLGLVSVALFPFSQSVAGGLLILHGRLLVLLRHLVAWFAGFDWSYCWVGLIPLWGLAAFYAGLGLILLARSRRRAGLRWLTSLLLAVSVLVGIVARHQRPVHFGALEVDVVDVGQGSSTLLVTPHGRTVLVDGGGYWGHAFDVGRNVLAPFLWQKGIDRLDLVILSHDHPDHRNGLRFILSQFEVGEYWETGYTQQPDGKTLLSRIAAARRVPLRRAAALPVQRVLDGCVLRILHPVVNRIDLNRRVRDPNNESLVLAVRFENTQVLIPGDIDSTVEKRLVFPNEALETVLIAPHHGSRRSTGNPLLNRLKPVAVLVSCGFHNVFGFPAREMLERVKAHQIPVLRTDRNGTLYAFSDGRTWRFRCHSGRLPMLLAGP